MLMWLGRNDVTDNSPSSLAEDIAATQDAFLGGRLTLRQPKSGPRAAIDPLFLAAAVPAKSGSSQSILDAGTGTGLAALALAARIPDIRVTGVDVQGRLLALAGGSAQLNSLEDRIELIEADVTDRPVILEGAGLARESFHHVMANPPYSTHGISRVSPDPATARAYSAAPGNLAKWIGFLAGMTKPHGTVTLIHKAEAVGELLALLNGPFGAISVYPLFPKSGLAAKRVIVSGRKASRAPLQVLQGMVLHEPDGSYTPEANAVLRDMAAIELNNR